MKSDYVISFKFIEDDSRIKFFSVWCAYLPIREKTRPWCKYRIKRNKVLYSKAAKDRLSTHGKGPKFFLPTPIGICALYGENTACPNKVAFTCLCYNKPQEMTLDIGQIGLPVPELHWLEGEGLVDFKVKLTNLFREEQGVFKAGWRLKEGNYDGIQMWDFHMGWDYWNGAYHYKFTPNKNFK